MKYLLLVFVSCLVFGNVFGVERCGENEFFNDCGSPCDRTCADPTPTCIEMCKARCECKPGFVVHPQSKKCVDLKKCPK